MLEFKLNNDQAADENEKKYTPVLAILAKLYKLKMVQFQQNFSKVLKTQFLRLKPVQPDGKVLKKLRISQ